MNEPTLAVTGVTGAVGGLVARLLAAAGVEQRLLARTVANAPDLPGATVHPFSFDDRAASKRALRGVEVLLMVSASEDADRLRQHRTFIDAAAAAGVRHVVYTSFAGAAPDCTFTLGRDHHATEEHIKAAGVTHTFLRDNFYLDFIAALPDEQGVIRGPAGTGRAAFVARSDVARSAAAVLRDPGLHADRTYELTGPDALSLADVAEILTRVQGRRIRYHEETVAEAYASRRAWTAPDWQYDAWVSTYTAIANGELEHVSGDVERLTGHPPLSLTDYLADSTRP